MEVPACVTRYHQRIRPAQPEVPEVKLGGPLAGLRTRSMTRDSLQSLWRAEGGIAVGDLGARSKTLCNLCSLHHEEMPLTHVPTVPSIALSFKYGLDEEQVKEWEERQKEVELLELSKREDLAVGTETLLPLMAYALVRVCPSLQLACNGAMHQNRRTFPRHTGGRSIRIDQRTIARR